MSTPRLLVVGSHDSLRTADTSPIAFVGRANAICTRNERRRTPCNCVTAASLVVRGDIIVRWQRRRRIIAKEWFTDRTLPIQLRRR